MKRILSALLAMATAASSLAANVQDSPLWIRKNNISPDGSKIAFCYKGDIFIVPSEGGRAFQLTSNPAYDSDPIWTPDGKQIVFSSYREGGKDIFAVSADGGTAKRLTTWSGKETPLAVTDDGEVWFSAAIQQDATYGNFPGSEQIYAVGLEGGRPRQVTSMPVGSMSINSKGIVIYEDIKDMRILSGSIIHLP